MCLYILILGVHHGTFCMGVLSVHRWKFPNGMCLEQSGQRHQRDHESQLMCKLPMLLHRKFLPPLISPMVRKAASGCRPLVPKLNCHVTTWPAEAAEWFVIIATIVCTETTHTGTGYTDDCSYVRNLCLFVPIYNHNTDRQQTEWSPAYGDHLRKL